MSILNLYNVYSHLSPSLKPVATYFRMMYLKAFELSSLRSQPVESLKVVRLE